MKRRKAIKATGIAISALFMGNTHPAAPNLLDAETFYMELLPPEYFLEFISLIANRFEQKVKSNKILKRAEKEIDAISVMRQCMDSILFTEDRATHFQKGIIQLNELQKTPDFSGLDRQLKVFDYVQALHPTNPSISPAFEVIQIIDKEIVDKSCQIILANYRQK